MFTLIILAILLLVLLSLPIWPVYVPEGIQKVKYRRWSSFGTSNQVIPYQIKYNDKNEPLSITFRGSGYKPDRLTPGLYFCRSIIFDRVETAEWPNVGSEEVGIVISQVGKQLPPGRRFVFLPEGTKLDLLQSVGMYLLKGGQIGESATVLTSYVKPLHPAAFLVVTRHKVYGIPYDAGLRTKQKKGNLTYADFGFKETDFNLTTVESGKIGLVTLQNGDPIPNGLPVWRHGGWNDFIGDYEKWPPKDYKLPLLEMPDLNKKNTEEIDEAFAKLEKEWLEMSEEKIAVLKSQLLKYGDLGKVCSNNVVDIMPQPMSIYSYEEVLEPQQPEEPEVPKGEVSPKDQHEYIQKRKKYEGDLVKYREDKDRYDLYLNELEWKKKLKKLTEDIWWKQWDREYKFGSELLRRVISWDCSKHGNYTNLTGQIYAGPQLTPILPGSYAFNKHLIVVKQVESTNVPANQALAVVSATGPQGHDITPSNFKFNPIVRPGFIGGIWSVAIGPGQRYPLNTDYLELDSWITSIMVLYWSDNKTMSPFDKNLNTIRRLSKDKVYMNVDLNAKISIPIEAVPFCKARFGSQEDLVNGYLQAEVTSWTMKFIEGHTAEEILTAQEVLGKDLHRHLTALLSKYNIEVREILFEKVDPEESYYKIVNAKTLADMGAKTAIAEKDLAVQQGLRNQQRGIAEALETIEVARGTVGARKLLIEAVKETLGEKAANALVIAQELVSGKHPGMPTALAITADKVADFLSTLPFITQSANEIKVALTEKLEEKTQATDQKKSDATDKTL